MTYWEDIDLAMNRAVHSLSVLDQDDLANELDALFEKIKKRRRELG